MNTNNTRPIDEKCRIWLSNKKNDPLVKHWKMTETQIRDLYEHNISWYFYTQYRFNQRTHRQTIDYILAKRTH